MRKYKAKFISALLVFATVLTVLSFVPNGTSSVEAATKITDADIAALKEKIKTNEKKISSYQTQISAIGGDLQKAFEAKELIDQQIGSIQSNIDSTDELIAKYDVYISEKEKIIVENENEISSKYDDFLNRMRISYEDGTRNYLELLVSSESLLDFMTRADNLGSVLSSEQKQLEELDRDVAELNSMKDALVLKQNEYVELAELQSNSREQLEAKLKESEKLIADLEKDKKAAEKAYNTATSKDKELDKELETLIKKYEEQKKNEAPGKLLWPVDPSYRNVTSKYGWRKLNGKDDFHLGIDIGISYGKNIYAANDGTVLTAKYHSSYGYYILIDHGGNLSTLYAHCSKLLVKAGEKVKRGQVIGLIGATGNAYGYHLHFEVRVSGSTTDPLKGSRLVILYNGKYVDPVANNLLKISG